MKAQNEQSSSLKPAAALDLQLEDKDHRALMVVLNTIPHHVFWKDRDSVYLGCNENFARVAGLDSPEEIQGKTDYDLPWKREEAEFFREIDQRVMAEGQPIINLEEPQFQADGSQRFLLTSKVPLRNEQGEIFGILGMFADITERKETELALEEARQRAEEANQAKGSFLATMSHELRTPLTLILSPLEELLKSAAEGLPDGVKESLMRVHRNAARLYVLVNDILDFSKLEAGKMGAQWGRCQLVELCEELLEQVLPAAQARRVSLEFSAEALEPAWIDPKKFEKILLNLLGNALKFTPEGGRIELTLARRDQDSYALRVADTGMGVSEEQMPHLFEKFWQADSSATRAQEGTGIGLSLVKEFTELMGGQIEVHSALGEGTTFLLTFPFVPAQAREAAAAREVEGEAKLSQHSRTWRHARSLGGSSTELPAASEAALPHSSPRPSLLVVDDNPDLRAFLHQVLHEEYEVHLAHNGQHALERLATLRPALIVSDVMMPVMSGTELTRRLKQDPMLRQIPVILLTAKVSRQDVIEGLEVGADDYLGKPFGADELRARIRSNLRLAQIHQELSHQRELMALSAGRAQVASDVLHNTGNLLTSANIAVEQLKDSLHESKLQTLFKALDLLLDHKDQAAGFLEGKRGQTWLELIGQLRPALAQEQQTQQQQLQRLHDKLHATIDTLSHQKDHVEGPQLERVSLPEIVDRALGLFGDVLHQGQIQLSSRLEPTDDVKGNRVDLMGIVVNLLKNAQEAMSNQEPSTRQLELHLWQDEAQVCLDVNDRGPGIAAGLQHQIFLQGFSTKPQGRGVGLHFCANRMNEFGGQIRWQNRPEGGATFSLLFPRWRDANHETEQP